MKIIHTADLHLDSKIDGFPTEKSRIRREEILRTFERLIDFACENKVSAIIIAGDMFDSQKITIKTKERIMDNIKRQKNIDFIYLSGNHDKDSFISDSGEKPSNLIVFEDRWQSISYADCVVSGIVVDELNKKTIYDDLRLDEQATNIVVMHGQVAGYKSSDNNAEIISIPSLKNKNIDYLALGHIHSYSMGEIDARGKFAYSGCLEGRGFDELGKKGFVLLDCKDGKIQSQFIPFAKRNLYEFEFDVAEASSNFELTQFIIDKLTSNISKESLVKVILKGHRSLNYIIDKFSLEKRLNEIFFFAKVYDKSELEISLSDYAFDKSIKGEFVRAVWESDLDNEVKNKIITCGFYALKGEEI